MQRKLVLFCWKEEVLSEKKRPEARRYKEKLSVVREFPKCLKFLKSSSKLFVQM